MHQAPTSMIEAAHMDTRSRATWRSMRSGQRARNRESHHPDLQERAGALNQDAQSDVACQVRRTLALKIAYQSTRPLFPAQPTLRENPVDQSTTKVAVANACRFEGTPYHIGSSCSESFEFIVHTSSSRARSAFRLRTSRELGPNCHAFTILALGIACSG